MTKAPCARHTNQLSEWKEFLNYVGKLIGRTHLGIEPNLNTRVKIDLF